MTWPIGYGGFIQYDLAYTDSALHFSRTWENWRDQFVLYVDSTMTTEEDMAKVKLFSCLIGESGRELLDTLMGVTAKEAWTMDDIINTFDEHYNPGANETMERYRFFSASFTVFMPHASKSRRAY